MNGSCHCGAVTIGVPGRPEYLNQCNCTVCTKLGTLWGYFAPGTVAFGGERRAYERVDVAEPELRFHFCGRCGTTTDWSPIDPAAERMGVNMRLFDPAALAGIEVRYGNRRDDEAVAARRYCRAPTIFGEGGAIA